MADEKLIIDVSVRDELTPALQKADKAVGNFATTAKAGFDKVDDSASKLSASVSNAGAGFEAASKKAASFADAARQKFEALGKAAIGIFAADVAAKVFGFSSALDVVSQAADAAANAIREFTGAAEFERQLEAQNRVLKANADAWDALRTARDAAAEAARGPGLQLPGVGGFGGQFISTAGLAPSDVQAVADRAQGLQEVFRTALAARDSATFNANQNTVAGITAIDQALNEFDAKISASVSEVVSFAESLRASRAAIEAEEKARREQERASRELQRDARSFRGSEQFGPPAPEFFDIPRGFEFIPSGSGGSSSSRGSGSTFSAEFNAANARRRAVAGRVAQNRRRDQSQFLPLEFTEAVQQTQQIASFAEQAAQSFDNLGNAIRSSIGDQVVLGSFNALSNFFAQAIQGQATLRDLGRSFVQLGAQILAQQAALRVLGFFGFGGAAAGAGVGAAGGAGVAAGGAAGSISLGSGGFSALGIQGGGQSFAASRGAGIQVSLSVTSLDPRGAADVVLSQMPVIQRALASSISNGSSRALRVAVGNA